MAWTLAESGGEKEDPRFLAALTKSSVKAQAGDVLNAVALATESAHNRAAALACIALDVWLSGYDEALRWPAEQFLGEPGVRRLISALARGAGNRFRRDPSLRAQKFHNTFSGAYG